MGPLRFGKGELKVTFTGPFQAIKVTHNESDNFSRQKGLVKVL